MASDGSEIHSIEAHIYRCELPAAQRFGYAQGWITCRESAVARLVTTDGTVGWGEAYALAQPAAAAITEIAPAFVGRSVFERVSIARMTAERLRIGQHRAPLAAALSAVATAACDAAARLLGLPVRALLGGAAQPVLRPYASGLWFAPAADPTAHYPAVAQLLRERGFTAIKAKIGRRPDDDVRTIEQLLRAVGDAAIMVDANQAYGVAAACQVVRSVAGSHLVWFEEPLSPACLADYPSLRARSSVPIAGGETIVSPREAHAWLTAGAVDVIQPDLCLAGGIDEAAAISVMASAAGTIVAPHCYGLGIGLAASLHWAAVIVGADPTADPVWIEVDLAPHPARDILLAECDWFRDGGATLTLPEPPGLGVDPERMAAFRVA